VAERNQVAGAPVYLGMRGESLAGHPAVKRGVALGCERRGIHEERGRAFLERVQLPAMNPGVGVGRAADPAPDGLLIGERVTVGAAQRPGRILLQSPLVGTRPTLPQVALSVMDVEARYHAVAVEGD